VVEGFLLGQGPTLRPGERHRTEQTRTVVVRLAEKEEAWRKQEVKPALGSWCESYITIRGNCCEPLNVELVQRLNQQLAAAQRRLQQQKVPS
jgi:hypothetical protein